VRGGKQLWWGFALWLSVVVASAGYAVCVGDCNRDGVVTIDEVWCAW